MIQEMAVHKDHYPCRKENKQRAGLWRKRVVPE
jgi:hypothetical protein